MANSEVRTKPFDERELAQARESFTKMKTYKDGTIHQSELMDYCNTIGIPTRPEQAEMYKTFWKANRGDELVPIDEMMEALCVMHDPKRLPMILANSFDKDGDGIISQEEFEIGMKSLMVYDPYVYGEMGGMSFKSFLSEADSNGDGLIQIDELAAWLSNK